MEYFGLAQRETKVKEDVEIQRGAKELLEALKLCAAISIATSMRGMPPALDPQFVQEASGLEPSVDRISSHAEPHDEEVTTEQQATTTIGIATAKRSDTSSFANHHDSCKATAKGEDLAAERSSSSSSNSPHDLINNTAEKATIKIESLATTTKPKKSYLAEHHCVQRQTAAKVKESLTTEGSDNNYTSPHDAKATSAKGVENLAAEKSDNDLKIAVKQATTEGMENLATERHDTCISSSVKHHDLTVTSKSRSQCSDLIAAARLPIPVISVKLTAVKGMEKLGAEMSDNTEHRNLCLIARQAITERMEVCSSLAEHRDMAITASTSRNHDVAEDEDVSQSSTTSYTSSHRSDSSEDSDSCTFSFRRRRRCLFHPAAVELTSEESLASCANLSTGYQPSTHDLSLSGTDKLLASSEAEESEQDKGQKEEKKRVKRRECKKLLLSIPRDTVGRFIGKQGRNIGNLMTKTGVKITVLQRNASQDSIPCKLLGKRDLVDLAARMIFDKFPNITLHCNKTATTTPCVYRIQTATLSHTCTQHEENSCV